MRLTINKGIDLICIKNDKFKNNRIEIHFLRPINDIKNMSYRALLSNILETSTQTYDDQVKMSKALSNMYGARFGSGVNKQGKEHDLYFVMSFSNDYYINYSEELFSKSINFLKEVILKPLTINNEFKPDVFQLQKENLLNRIVSMNDDKQYYAMNQLKLLNYGEDDLQGLPSYGTLTEIKRIKNKELYDYYQEMIQKDLIKIISVGDIESKQVEENFRSWNLSSRSDEINDITTKFEPVDKVLEKIDYKKVQQAKLNLAYEIPVFNRGKNYFTGLVFNALFGGTPQSKLFINVREKAQLAYYANSTLDLYNGMMLVQMGIDPKNKEIALKIVDEQLKNMQDNITSIELQEAKLGLKSSYLSNLDQEKFLSQKSLLDELLKTTISESDWLQKLDQVNLKEVVDLAKVTKLRSIYFLTKDVVHA